MVTDITLSYFFHLVMFLSVCTLGLTIECFQCNSAEHPECSDLKVNDTNSRFYKKCDGVYGKQEPFCRKIVTKIFAVEGSTRIYRSCAWINSNGTSSKDLCRKADTDFIKKMHCHCYSNGCNSSDRIMPSSTAVVVVAIVANVFREIGLI